MQDFPAALAAALKRAKERRKEADEADDVNFWQAFSKGELYRETTYGMGSPGKSKPLGKVVAFVPTAEDLRRHMARFGPEGVGTIAHALGINMQARTPKAPKPKRQRRSSVELRRLALELHKRGLMEEAIADELNVSDRRVKELLATAA